LTPDWFQIFAYENENRAQTFSLTNFANLPTCQLANLPTCQTCTPPPPPLLYGAMDGVDTAAKVGAGAPKPPPAPGMFRTAGLYKL
jgi:hypothetical protein